MGATSNWEDGLMRGKSARLAPLLIAFTIILSSWNSAQAIGVGDKAPDFELESSKGGKLKLSSLKGKNVLINFYVLDFSPT
jgi:hypothetical protein